MSSNESSSRPSKSRGSAGVLNATRFGGRRTNGATERANRTTARQPRLPRHIGTSGVRDAERVRDRERRRRLWLSGVNPSRHMTSVLSWAVGAHDRRFPSGPSSTGTAAESACSATSAAGGQRPECPDWSRSHVVRLSRAPSSSPRIAAEGRRRGWRRSWQEQPCAANCSLDPGGPRESPACDRPNR